MTKVFLLSLAIMSITTLTAKELFTKEKISQYLTEENPFVYAAIGKKYIYKEKRKKKRKEGRKKKKERKKQGKKEWKNEKMKERMNKIF